MRIVKGIALAVAALMAALLVAAALLPDRFRMERTVTVDAPVATVYPLVANLPDWLLWNPFTEQDPTVKSLFSGDVGTVGASWAFEGEVTGTGLLTVEELVPDAYMRSRLEFTAPQTMTSADIWHFEGKGATTEVRWVSEGGLDYPVGRFFGLFMEDMMGPTLEKGLANLKGLSESRAKEETVVPDTPSDVDAP